MKISTPPIVLGSLLAAQMAHAALHITIAHSKNSFDISASGSLDLTGLTYVVTSGVAEQHSLDLLDDGATVILSNLKDGNVDYYMGLTSIPSSLFYGTSIAQPQALSYTGSLSFLLHNESGDALIAIDSTYTGAPQEISFTQHYEAPGQNPYDFINGQYIWSWAADQIVIDVVSVPEPASSAMILAGVTLMLCARRINRTSSSHSNPS